MTYEEAKNKIESSGEFLLLSTEYKNNRSKVRIKHIPCGNEYMTTLKDHFDSVKNTEGCRFCRKNKNKLPFEKVKYEIEKSGHYQLLSTEYKNNHGQLLIKHLDCGNTFKTSLGGFRNLKSCRYCSGKALDFNIVKSKIESSGEYELLSTEYKKNTGLLKIKCLKCGNVFESRFDTFMYGYRCKVCSGYKKSYDQIKEIIESSGEYELVSKTADNCFVEVEIKHKKCGTIFKMTANKFKYKKWPCPKCQASGTSAEEKELFEFIKSIYNGEIVFEYRSKDLNNKEIDIYLPELKIGFEYDGLYWHSNEFLDNNAHLNKTKLCEDNGIRLVHIFSDEWKNKREIIEDKIKNIIGVNTCKIYARKCKISKISLSEKNIFLNTYHIQGADKSSVYYGLKYNDELVAVMTFTRNRLVVGGNKSEEWELSRFATKYNVVGGFSKLLSYIVKNNNIKIVKTFADARFTSKTKNVYLTNGFVYDHTSQPNYYYIKNGKRYYRFNFSKQNLKKNYPDFYDEKLTENEITSLMGLTKIYDCGNYVFYKIF